MTRFQQKTIGIATGGAAVTYAVVETSGSQRTITDLGAEQAKTKKDPVTAVVKALVARKGNTAAWRNGELRLNLERPAWLNRKVTYPAELAGLYPHWPEWEMRQGLLAAPEGLVIDFWKKALQTGERATAQAVVTRREPVEMTQRILDEAGLECQVFLATPLALWAAHQTLSAGLAGTTVLLDVGEEVTNLAVGKDGELDYIEALTTPPGLFDTPPRQLNEGFVLLKSELTRALAEEVATLLRSQGPDLQNGKIALSGPGASDAEIQKAIATALSLPVEPANLLAACDWSSELKPKREDFLSQSHRYSVALGLALAPH